MDYIATMAHARDKGIEQGIEVSIKNTVIAMLDEGFTDEIICKVLNISEEKVNEIRELKRMEPVL